MDRSTRNLSIITLLVLATFLALNHIARRSGLADWGIVLFILLLALAVWFYDRVSRRGADDSEVEETVIEPVIYDHHDAASDAIQLVPRNPGTVIHVTPTHASDVYTEPTPLVTDVPSVVAPAAHAEAVITPPAPAPAQPVGQPPTSADLPSARMSEENARAPMPESVLETASGLPTEVKEVPPQASPAQQPASAAPATTIEEKAAPPPSAPAAETHPDLAAKAPAGANLPSIPVSDKTAGEPVPSPIPGSAPEPVAPRSSTEPVPTIPPKEAASTAASAPTASPVSEINGSPLTVSNAAPTTPDAPPPAVVAAPVADEVKVSASEAADAAPVSPDPTLPMNAVTDKPDDLKIIEGIGPKMEKALQAAGISTFAMLSGASETQIQAAITAAGMRFAPSVPTWAEQASYAANGDFVGLEAYQKTLVGGRKAK